MGVFKAALVVVDFQEDFCPPNGSLAVPHGRDIAPLINSLLSLPFAMKLATRDWHPAGHVSFAVNHAGASPFQSTALISDPQDQSSSYTTRLWPVHCVQDSPGAQLIAELDSHLFDRIINKGKNPRVEMFSAFYDPFHVSDSGLADMLRGEGVTHVFIGGLALDYCVKATALDAAAEGFKTYVIEEATKAIDASSVEALNKELGRAGVKVVGVDSDELDLVRKRRVS